MALTKLSLNQFFEIFNMERLMAYFVDVLPENWLKLNSYQLIRKYFRASLSRVDAEMNSLSLKSLFSAGYLAIVSVATYRLVLTMSQINIG